MQKFNWFWKEKNVPVNKKSLNYIKMQQNNAYIEKKIIKSLQKIQ